MITVILCSLFYAYVVFAINVYRQEIVDRANEGYVIRYKVKAPFTIKVSVLLILTAFAANFFLFVVVGSDYLILINTPPALFFVIILARYQRKIKKIDKENYDVFL